MGEAGKVMLEKFAGTKPRENAGSRSANRFDYQKSWSLCELLRLHANQSDYLMVFDFHEDVVVFNSEANPTESHFYQIKTNSRNWTTANLSKKGKGTTPSIIEKLVSSYATFKNEVSALHFVSDKPFRVGKKGENGTRILDEVVFSELNDAHKQTICDALFLQNTFCDLHALSKLHFYRCDLTPSNHRELTKGRLVTFFGQEHPDKTIDIPLAYRTLADEIGRRTGYEGSCTTVDELKANKSLCRKDFDKYISVFHTRRSKQEHWLEISQRLVSEGCSAIKQKRIRQSWQRYITDQMNPNNLLCERHRNAVVAEIDKQIDAGFDGKMLDLASVVHAKVNGTYDELYTAAIVLMEIIADDTLSKTYQESADEVE